MLKILTVAAVLVFSFTCQAQTIEYGSPADLKGITKIFVDTGTEMEVRKNILKEISKSKKKIPDLIIVSRPEDAEIILSFGAVTNTYLSGINTTPTYGGIISRPTYGNVIQGNGIVVKLLANNRVRLIMSFEDSRSSRWERRPSTNFAREFVRAYMDANKR